jgi:hypothetical protein
LGSGRSEREFGNRSTLYIPPQPSRRALVLQNTADEDRSELAREKMWSRIHLIPLLTAEEDRDLVRRHYADQAREKELLGSQTSPYNSDRYDILGLQYWSEEIMEIYGLLLTSYRFVRPTFAITPSQKSK